MDNNPNTCPAERSRRMFIYKMWICLVTLMAGFALVIAGVSNAHYAGRALESYQEAQLKIEQVTQESKEEISKMAAKSSRERRETTKQISVLAGQIRELDRNVQQMADKVGHAMERPQEQKTR